MFIGNPKTTLPTDTRAFAAETAAIPGEINLRVTAAAAKQNLFRAGADTVTALIAQMNKGPFRYCPRQTMRYRSGWRATPQQPEFIASHRCSPVFPVVIAAHCTRPVQAGIDLNQGIPDL
jgi:hypothetical protein